MWEVWWQVGRTRKVVARFRLLKDARKYLSKQGAEEGSFELIEADPYGLGSDDAERPRRWSAAPASEHPDEFIADRFQADDSGDEDVD